MQIRDASALKYLDRELGIDHTDHTDHLSEVYCIFTCYSSSSFTYEQKKYLWAQLDLPPITLSWADQSPDQRLVFP